MNWKSADSAPKDGTFILVAHNNGIAWEYYIVWWHSWDISYPWQSYDNVFPENYFEYWQYIQEPYEIVE